MFPLFKNQNKNRVPQLMRSQHGSAKRRLLSHVLQYGDHDSDHHGQACDMRCAKPCLSFLVYTLSVDKHFPPRISYINADTHVGGY